MLSGFFLGCVGRGRVYWGKGMGKELDQAVERVDLPGLVGRLWPESGAKPGKPGLYRAVWRGDQKPSLSLFRSARGVWLWKDHATGEGGNAYHLLLKAGLSPREAADVLLEQAEVAPPPPPPRRKEGRLRSEAVRLYLEARDRLRRARELPQVLLGRGFTLEDAIRLELGVSPEGDLLIPIRNLQGELVAVKVRHLHPQNGIRYRYLGRTPAYPWLSPSYGKGKATLVVEGELNAMALYLALGDQVGVAGVAGAFGHLPPSVEGPVYLVADGDRAGRQALGRWQKALKGVALVPEEMDACEIAGTLGREALRERFLRKLKWS